MTSKLMTTAGATMLLAGTFVAGGSAFAATPPPNPQATTTTDHTDTKVQTPQTDPKLAPRLNFNGSSAANVAAAPAVVQAPVVQPTTLSKIPTTMFPPGHSSYNEVTHIKGFIGWLVGSLDSTAQVQRDPNIVTVQIHNAKYGDTTVTLKPDANDPNKVMFDLDKTYTASISNVTPNSFTANLDGAGPVNFVMNPSSHVTTITGVPNITVGGRSIGIASLVMTPSH